MLRHRSLVWLTAAALTAPASIASGPAQGQAQGEYADVWITQFGSPGTDLDPLVSASPDGGSFIGGSTTGDLFGPNVGLEDGYVTRLDLNGQPLWSVRFATASEDGVNDVESDGAGGVLVAGRTRGDLFGPANGDFDPFVAHITASGTTSWAIQFGTPSFDLAWSVLPDGAGGAIAMGNTRGSLGGASGGGNDVFLVRIDASGSILSSSQWGGPLSETVGDMVADGAGGLLFGGATNGTVFGPNAGGTDAYVARLDSAGNLSWSTTLGSVSADNLLAIEAVAPDEIYVGGGTSGALFGPALTVFSGFVARLDGTGAVTWGRRTVPSEVSSVTDLTPAPGGGVLAVGARGAQLGPGQFAPTEPLLTRFDAQGSETLLTFEGSSENDRFIGIGVVGSGQVLVSGSTEGSLAAPNAGELDSFVARLELVVGVNSCGPAVANSTGQAGRILAVGSAISADNTLRLQALGLPPRQFGVFLASPTLDLVPGFGGGLGTLCLGGPPAIYRAPDQVRPVRADGRLELVLDLTRTPTPAGLVPIQSGQTWSFQAWFRDRVPQLTSNFTDATTVAF